MSTDPNSDDVDLDLVVLIRSMICPHCSCQVIRGLTASGETVFVVQHAATCPRIPEEQRALGNTIQQIPTPQSFTVDLEDSTDDQRN